MTSSQPAGLEYPIRHLPDQVAEATLLYQSGQSLASIATAPAAPRYDATGDALIRANMKLCPRGRRGSASSKPSPSLA